MPIWKFYLCHGWLQERVMWEDVAILPANPEFQECGYWLTFTTLGDGPEDPEDPRSVEFYERCVKQLDGRKYWVRKHDEPPLGDVDFLVDAVDFVKEELVSWIRVWLVENGHIVDDLVEAPISEYFDRMHMIEALHGLKKDD